MWRRSACAAAAATVLAVSVAPPASASPPVWRPLFASDFSDPTVPPECDSFDAPATVPGATYFRPDEVSVHDGMLHLSLHRRDYGGRPYTGGGIGCVRLAQTYGRYEFRARPAPGCDSYATLAPPGAGDPVRLSLPGGGDFHAYTVDWTPAGVNLAVDGGPASTVLRPATGPRWVGFAVVGTAHPGPLPADFAVDWLRVYAYDGPPPAKAARRSGTRTVLTWAAAVLVAVAAVVLGGYAVSRRRPRRPAPGHRA